VKAAEWKRVVRPLLPVGQSWAFRGQLCYLQPVEWVLTGVLGEGSGFHTGVYLWQVSMPMFVPSDVVSLSFSSRVGGGARIYDTDEPAALHQAISAGLAATTAAEPLRVIACTSVTKNARLFEERAYARILIGDLDSASADLAAAAASEVTVPWVQDIVDRANLIRELLESDGEVGVTRQLASWRDYTCAALGIAGEGRGTRNGPPRPDMGRRPAVRQDRSHPPRA